MKVWLLWIKLIYIEWLQKFNIFGQSKLGSSENVSSSMNHSDPYDYQSSIYNSSNNSKSSKAHYDESSELAISSPIASLSPSPPPPSSFYLSQSEAYSSVLNSVEVGPGDVMRTIRFFYAFQ